MDIIPYVVAFLLLVVFGIAYIMHRRGTKRINIIDECQKYAYTYYGLQFDRNAKPEFLTDKSLTLTLYDPNTSIAIEFDTDDNNACKKSLDYDLTKKKHLCKKAGVDLIVVPSNIQTNNLKYFLYERFSILKPLYN